MRVHTAKYGAFGISFAKRFLVAQGASPVLYVERNSLSHVRRDDIPSGVHSNFAPAMYWSRAEFYDQVDAALDAELGLSEGTPADDGSDSAARRGLIREFLLRHVLPYLKFFDSGLADEHVDNFYMEREWRVPGVVTFRLRDVERIWVPRTWRERLRIDLPDYDGQISFL